MRKEKLAVTVTSQCAHCGQPMEIRIDSDLHYEVPKGEAPPVVFMPEVDFSTLADDSIVDAF